MCQKSEVFILIHYSRNFFSGICSFRNGLQLDMLSVALFIRTEDEKIKIPMSCRLNKSPLWLTLKQMARQGYVQISSAQGKPLQDCSISQWKAALCKCVQTHVYYPELGRALCYTATVPASREGAGRRMTGWQMHATLGKCFKTMFWCVCVIVK